MTVPKPRDPSPRATPTSAETSSAEKLAAEWEARHDVAARGHCPDPLAVQHYLALARTEQARQHVPPTPAPPVRPAPGAAPGAAAEPRAGRRPVPARWWRRMLRRP